jgi:rubrerythrin
VLAPLLAGEYAVLRALGGDPADPIARQDRGHADRLRQAIVAAGGRPEGAGGGGEPGPVLVRKQQNVFGYVAALPRLADPELRVLVMELAASEAEHLAALRLAAGEEPVPDAFAGFTEAGT